VALPQKRKYPLEEGNSGKFELRLFEEDREKNYKSALLQLSLLVTANQDTGSLV
jgi:hypothetical protein